MLYPVIPESLFHGALMEGQNFKEFLVFVIGTTPQIITETIYALSQKDHPVYPDQIYIITTTAGKTSIEKSIIEKGILDNLCKEYSIPQIFLSEDSIIVPRDSSGNKLADIRNESDNQLIAKTILNLIKELSQDESIRLHCSIAGGRKTMSFYLGSALQLFGRRWDKLYHVLVSPPELESNPEFFYKPKTDKTLEYRMPDGSIKKLNTSMARIELAEIPFIRLRDKIQIKEKNYPEIINHVQMAIDNFPVPAPLNVYVSERKIQIGDKIIYMQPAHFMVYLMFLIQKIECSIKKHHDCHNCKDRDCFVPIGALSGKDGIEKIKSYLERLFKPEKINNFLPQKDISQENLRQYISKINKKLKEALEDTNYYTTHYIISSTGPHGETRYGVLVEKSMINIK